MILDPAQPQNVKTKSAAEVQVPDSPDQSDGKGQSRQEGQSRQKSRQTGQKAKNQLDRLLFAALPLCGRFPQNTPAALRPAGR